jgi:AraC-like DNA-binding protein
MEVLSKIAEELGYDSKYLSSLFKKRKGVTYTKYLREQRIKHAIFLMEEGVVSVKNVAILSGFRDALYFSKIFTQSTGLSPKAYIAKITGESEE